MFQTAVVIHRLVPLRLILCCYGRLPPFSPFVYKTVKLLVFSVRDIAVPFYSISAQSILIIDIGKDSFQIRLTGGLRPMRDEEMFWMKNVVL